MFGMGGAMPTINRVAEFHGEMTAWRHDLHAHPELGFEETRTAAFVARMLDRFGLAVHRGLAGTGVVGTLTGRGDSGRTIGLRADMDALPITEETGLAYASRTPGKMHACGHDGHTAMLLGAARALAETRNFDGTVHFIFQPAEEGLAGARAMIDDGLFDRFACDAVYGLHNWPELPVGSMAIHTGPVMAAGDRFEITVTGRGSHAAMPHQGVDPVLIAAQITVALQSLVSRMLDPIDPGVVSVTQVSGGTAFNVIPDRAVLGGTVRSLRRSTQDRLARGIDTLGQGIAAAFGATATLDFRPGYPVTENTAAEATLAAAAAERVIGADRVVRDAPPSMAAEDFAFMLERRPGAYVWLGQAGPTMVHNPRYDFNDEILPIGASYWVSLVETVLPRTG